MIKIHDIKLLIDALEALSIAIPSCKICISKDGLIILTKNNFSRIKLVCNKTVVSSDNDLEFCIGELNKFISLLKIVAKYRSSENEIIEIDYNGSHLKYNGARTKFKFGTIKHDVISKFIDSEINANIEIADEFEIDFDVIKELLSSRSIITNTQTLKFVFYEHDVKKKMVFCDIKDTENPLSSELSFHIGNCKNSLPMQYAINQDRLILMQALKSTDKCSVKCTSRGILILNMQNDNGTNLTIYTSSLKM